MFNFILQDYEVLEEPYQPRRRRISASQDRANHDDVVILPNEPLIQINEHQPFHLPFVVASARRNEGTWLQFLEPFPMARNSTFCKSEPLQFKYHFSTTTQRHHLHLNFDTYWIWTVSSNSLLPKLIFHLF